MSQRVVVAALVERRDPASPSFVRVPTDALDAWKLSGPTTVNAELAGHALGRRPLKRYDAGTWMLELSGVHLRWAGIGPGDLAEVSLWRDEAPAEPPAAPDPEPTVPEPKAAKARAPRRRA